jgi:OOP family OmpA-OmpF porin
MPPIRLKYQIIHIYPGNTLSEKGGVTMKNRLGSILLAVLMLSATAAFGAVKEGQFSVSPVIGGYAYEDAKNSFENKLVYGGRAGYNFTKRFGIEGLFDYAELDNLNGVKGDTRMYRYGGEVLYHILPDNTLVPYLAAGFAGLRLDGESGIKKTVGAFDYGLGAKYFLNDSFALRADVRHIIFGYDKATYNNVEYTLGAHIPFGGVAPVVQPVAPPPPPPPAPEPAKVVPPPPPAPSANLSVSTATLVKSNSATLSWTSSNADKCSIQPGIGPVETVGSRSITPSESTVYTLTCSGPGGDATSRANIGVTIPPPPPAPAPVLQSAQKASAAQERFCDKPAILAVQFDTNKADIKPKYKADLEKLAEFLTEFPNAKGEISGHTDNVGGKAFNTKLSQRRADSVVQYMKKNFNISPERLTAKGFGFSKPIASNKTKAGKAKNRRIEANFSCK